MARHLQDRRISAGGSDRCPGTRRITSPTFGPRTEIARRYWYVYNSTSADVLMLRRCVRIPTKRATLAASSSTLHQKCPKTGPHEFLLENPPHLFQHEFLHFANIPQDLFAIFLPADFTFDVDLS